RLIKYFLASITVPEKDLWVNLSPYEKDRIIPDAFGVTEMGRDLLAQDYMLKQITASVIYPEGETGKAFWAKVYAEAEKRYGTTDIPVDTFNKVWIVPEKAVVYESKDSAYVVESKLKVMLESDYVAQARAESLDVNASVVSGLTSQGTQDLAKQVLRDIVIPILEKEVNEGKNFAQLRQVYNSLILAVWYKDKVRESIFGKAYVDRNKTGGVDIEDKAAKDKIWAQYVEAFKKGAYNYIKEDLDPATQQMVPRKYFSGGVGFDGGKVRGVRQRAVRSQLSEGVSERAMIVRTNLDAAKPGKRGVTQDTPLLSVGRVTYDHGEYTAKHTDRKLQPFKSWMSLARSLFHTYDSEFRKISDRNVLPENAGDIRRIIDGLRDGLGVNIGQILTMRTADIRRRLNVLRAAVLEENVTAFTNSANGLNHLLWSKEPELEGTYTQIRVALRIVTDRGIGEGTRDLILKALDEAGKRLGLLDDLRILFDRYQENYVRQRGLLGNVSDDEVRVQAFEMTLKAGGLSSSADQLPRVTLLFYQLAFVSAREHPEYFKMINSRIHHRPLVKEWPAQPEFPESLDAVKPAGLFVPAVVREAWFRFASPRLEDRLSSVQEKAMALEPDHTMAGTIKEEERLERLLSPEAWETTAATRSRSAHEHEKLTESFAALMRINRPVKTLFVMPMYKEIQRLQPRSKENPFGEDALRVKVAQFVVQQRRNPNFEWRILAVDDGTPEEASARLVEKIWKEIQEEYRQAGMTLAPDLVQVLSVSPEEKNLTGSRKGYATVKALKQAVANGWADYIGYTDTDISTNVMQTPLLLESLINGGVDAAIGSRWAAGGKAQGALARRYFSSKIFNLMIRTLLPPLGRIYDTQRGFKLFTRENLSAILDNARDPGMSFDTELLLLTKLSGGNVQEVPISWFDSFEASTVTLGDEAKRMAKGILKYQTSRWLDKSLILKLRSERKKIKDQAAERQNGVGTGPEAAMAKAGPELPMVEKSDFAMTRGNSAESRKSNQALNLLTEEQASRVRTLYQHHRDLKLKELKSRLSPEPLELPQAIRFCERKKGAVAVALKLPGDFQKFLNVLESQELFTAGFEVLIARIRGTTQWILFRGAGEGVADEFLEENALLFDVILHQHPTQDEPIPSPTDFRFDYLMNAGPWTHALIIGRKGLTRTDASQMISSNLDYPHQWDMSDFRKDLRELRTRSDIDLTDIDSADPRVKPLYDQWLKERKGRYSFKTWGSISVSDFTPLEFDPAVMIQSPSPHIRARALFQLLEMLPSLKETGLGEGYLDKVIRTFIHDPREDVQLALVNKLIDIRFRPEYGLQRENFKAFLGSPFPNVKRLVGIYETTAPDQEMAGNKGGIDLTRDKMGLQVQSEGQGVQFTLDPVMIQQLQNASGLTPIIIDIQPMTTTVPMFLGLTDDVPVADLHGIGTPS
ncbi:MAG: hypothetical protein HQL21_04120, partial [Candidatus Omnitrophica bacterium]|nr:hypothetical protein [Candidatus Omnitrophota bacterium]